MSIIIKEIRQDLKKKPTERFIGGWIMTALMSTIVSETTTNEFVKRLSNLIGFYKEDYDNFVNSTNQKFADIFEIIDEKFSALIEKVINLQSNQAEKIETLSTKIDIVQQQLQDKIQCLETQLQERPTATEITSITTNPNYDHEQVIRKMVEIIAVSWGVHYQEMDISNILSWDRIALEQIIDNIDNYFRVRYINETIKHDVIAQINGKPKVQGLFENLANITKKIRESNPGASHQEIIAIAVKQFMEKYEQLLSEQHQSEKIENSSTSAKEVQNVDVPIQVEQLIEPLDDGKPAKRKSKK